MNPVYGSALTPLWEKERDAGDMRDIWVGHLPRATPRTTSNTSECNRSSGRTTDRRICRAPEADTPSSRMRFRVFWIRFRSRESDVDVRNRWRRGDAILRLFRTPRLRRHLDVRHSRACRVVSRDSRGMSARESQSTWIPAGCRIISRCTCTSGVSGIPGW